MKKNDQIRRENLLIAIGMVGTAIALAEKANVSSAYLSQVKNKTPDSKTGKPKHMGDDVARRIEDAIGKGIGWMDTDHSMGGQNQPNAIDVVTKGKLPLISWVQAGEWSEIVDNFQPGEAEEWIPCPFNHGPNAFILRVDGYSMYNPGGDKSYAPGEYIAVDPRVHPMNKKLVVVRVDHEEKATFKQLLVDADGGMLLQALNPSHSPRVMELPLDSRIVGVVIGKWVPE